MLRPHLGTKLRLFFQPAIAIMNRLSYVLKFLLIGILLLAPFAYVTHIMIKGADKQIIFNQKESYGVEYITPGYRVLGKLQRCRIYSAAGLAGVKDYDAELKREIGDIDVLLREIEIVDEKHRQAFKTEDGKFPCATRLQEIKTAWGHLRYRQFQSQQESFAAYTELCSIVTDWILNYAANYSNLILDPDLDSYWLMDAFVAKLPLITEDLSRTCAISIGYFQPAHDSSPASTDEEWLQLASLYSESMNTFDAFISVNMKTAYEFNNIRNKTLQARLDPFVQRAVMQTRPFLTVLRQRIVSRDDSAVPVNEYVASMSHVLGAIDALYEEIAPALNTLILARVDDYSRDKYWGTLAAEGATFLHVYIFIAFYLAVRSSVSRLGEYTKRMIAGTQETFKLEAHDELGQVANSYNEINRELIEVRALKEQVEKRTEDLSTANAQLHSEISDRKKAERERDEINKQLVDLSREAGKAEVATNVLHNVGNVLNSVNVSTTLLLDTMRQSQTTNLEKVAVLIKDHSHDWAAFVTNDRKGKMLPTYISQLAAALTSEYGVLRNELNTLNKSVAHIREIVNMQQAYASVSGFSESVMATDLVEDALRLNAAALLRHDVQTVRDYVDNPQLYIDRHKVLQILVNLMRNAKYAIDDLGSGERRLTVRVVHENEVVRISVIDTGVGICQKNLIRIFNHGFTTRKEGHGFGLHSASLAAKEMGGRLLVRSDGPGKGATFDLEIPLKTAEVSR